jgi:hypothetical protein
LKVGVESALALETILAMPPAITGGHVHAHGQ